MGVPLYKEAVLRRALCGITPWLIFSLPINGGVAIYKYSTPTGWVVKSKKKKKKIEQCAIVRQIEKFSFSQYDILVLLERGYCGYYRSSNMLYCQEKKLQEIQESTWNNQVRSNFGA